MNVVVGIGVEVGGSSGSSGGTGRRGKPLNKPKKQCHERVMDG